MIEYWTQLRGLVWEGRWDGIVMIWNALATNVMTYWWFGPLLLLIVVGSSGKAWMKLTRYVGLAYFRGHVNS